MSPSTSCQRCQLKYCHKQQTGCRHWEVYPHDQRMLPCYWQQTAIQVHPSLHHHGNIFFLYLMAQHLSSQKWHLWVTIRAPHSLEPLWMCQNISKFNLVHMQMLTMILTWPTVTHLALPLPFVWGPTIIFKVYISSSMLTQNISSSTLSQTTS